MELVHLPAAHLRSLETFSHTALSVSHLLTQRRTADAAVMFNAANAPFVPLLRGRGIPVAVHVDGLEWQRSKWQGAGRRYYRQPRSSPCGGRMPSSRTPRASPTTTRASSGRPPSSSPTAHRSRNAGRHASRSSTVGEAYHLVVARFEPENHVEEIVQGYSAASRHPLVVVGSAPYSGAYTAEIRSMADTDPRVRLLGGVWDQRQLDELYANALTYVHGHSVGGTNPPSSVPWAPARPCWPTTWCSTVRRSVTAGGTSTAPTS